MLQNLDIAAGVHRKTAEPDPRPPRRSRARRAGAGDDRPDVAGRTGRRGSSPTARSSGWRSACCLVQDAKVMFLDETVAGMSVEERRRRPATCSQRIVGDRTIVVIEHDMEFMRTLRRLRHRDAQRQGARRGTVAEIQADARGARGLPGHRRRRRSARWLSPMLEIDRCHRRLRAHRWCCSTSTCRCPRGGGAAVMGHNGAGKTTLLRVAVGLDPGAGRARCSSTARTSPRSPQPPGPATASATCPRASSASPR